eukprot:12526151-Alexandrium_andersonii.AAC.1
MVCNATCNLKQPGAYTNRKWCLSSGLWPADPRENPRETPPKAAHYEAARWRHPCHFCRSDEPRSGAMLWSPKLAIA